jgi:carbon starvation protein CstA
MFLTDSKGSTCGDILYFDANTLTAVNNNKWGLEFYYMSKAIAWPHHFTTIGVLGPW